MRSAFSRSLVLSLITAAGLALLPTVAAAEDRPAVSLQTYSFPDGTGTVGVAPGWTTNSPSCMGGVSIKGPADQTVTIGLCASVVTPDSGFIQTQRQLEESARQMGMQMPPRPQVLTAPFTAPAEALKNLMPQISQMSQQRGGPALQLDRILEEKPAQAGLAGGKAALLSYAITKTTDGVARHYRAAAQIETDPAGNEAWLLYVTELSAPEDTYQQDLPAMLAMAKSLKTNDAVIQQNARQNMDAQNQRFAAMQQAHRDQVEGFDRSNKAWERRQLSQSRNNADFDETIRGYRTVEDTRTGDRTSVNLGDAHDVVNKLNEGDPGRYKEVPLKDEMYPVPPEQGK